MAKYSIFIRTDLTQIFWARMQAGSEGPMFDLRRTPLPDRSSFDARKGTLTGTNWGSGISQLFHDAHHNRGGVSGRAAKEIAEVAGSS